MYLVKKWQKTYSENRTKTRFSVLSVSGLFSKMHFAPVILCVCLFSSLIFVSAVYFARRINSLYSGFFCLCFFVPGDE